MIDLIKTFILGIWIDKKYRYLFLFFVVSGLYRFIKWMLVLMTFELTPVDFVKIQDDGALVFNFARKYEQVIYPVKYQLPTRYGKNISKFNIKGLYKSKECEKEFFKIYASAVDALIRSSENKKFVIEFEKKFPKKVGEISYVDANKNVVEIFKALQEQGMIFQDGEDVNYCKILQDRKMKFK